MGKPCLTAQRQLTAGIKKQTNQRDYVDTQVKGLKENMVQEKKAAQTQTEFNNSWQKKDISLGLKLPLLADYFLCDSPQNPLLCTVPKMHPFFQCFPVNCPEG